MIFSPSAHLASAGTSWGTGGEIFSLNAQLGALYLGGVMPPGAVDRKFGLYFGGFFGRRTGPRGEKMIVACPGTDSQVLATILDPFRAIFADLGPDRLSEI